MLVAEEAVVAYFKVMFCSSGRAENPENSE
jgi:hypothetical protein